MQVRDESMYSELVIYDFNVKKGRGQRKNRRNREGRRMHRIWCVSPAGREVDRRLKEALKFDDKARHLDCDCDVCRPWTT